MSTEPIKPLSYWIPTRVKAVKIALWYAALGALWILSSGWLLHQLIHDADLAALFEDIKGWFYVSVTAFLLGLVLDRYFREIRRSAQQLQDNETRLRLIENNLPDCYVYQYCRDPDGQSKFLYISAGVDRIHGVSTENILHDATCLLGQIDVAQQSEYRNAEEESARTLSDLDMDLKIWRPDKTARLIHVKSRPRLLAGGRVMWDGVVVDNTARQQTEAALRTSETGFRAIFEMASIGMAQSDPLTGKFLHVNQKMCAITGYCVAELQEMTVGQITYPEDRAQDWESFQRVVRGEAQDYRMEKRYLRKDGQTAWVNVNMTVLRDAAGKPTRTMATIEDITERKKTAESQALLAMAVEQSAEAVMITGADARILYVNPAFAKITGYTSSEAIGMNPSILKSGKHDAAFYRKLWKTLLEGKTWRGILINKHKDGHLFTEESSISPMVNSAGAVVNYVAVKRDVTREQELELQLTQAQKLESVGTLASGIAHDLNNILSPLLMGAQCLLDEKLTASQREIVETMESSATRGAEIIRQVLTFARVVDGKKGLIQTKHVIREVLGMIRSTFPRSITILDELPADLWPVNGDFTQLHQILLNLCVNARDAMPRGGTLTIRAENRHLDAASAKTAGVPEPGTHVVWTVTDTGEGIPEDVLPRIFDPFFTTKALGKGTGLGLSTAHGIVRSHKGSIHARSTPGRGAQFEVFLPANAGLTPDTVLQQAIIPQGRGELILVVDDEEDIRTMVQALLIANGYNTLTARNGVEAISIVAERREAIKAIMLDMMMPEMGGDVAKQIIRKMAPKLAIIIMSGLIDDFPRTEDDYTLFIRKPFDKAELLPALRIILDHTA